MKLSEKSAQELEQHGYLKFAQVGRPHGIQGCFFLKTTDNRTEWDEYSKIVVAKPDGFYESEVTKHYTSGKNLVLQVNDMSSRTEVESLYHADLYIHKSQLKLAADEVTVHDLTYMTVINQAGEIIGTCLGVVNFGAQDNLHLFNKNTQKEFYFPMIPGFLVSIDEDKKQITIRNEQDFLD